MDLNDEFTYITHEYKFQLGTIYITPHKTKLAIKANNLMAIWMKTNVLNIVWWCPHKGKW